MYEIYSLHDGDHGELLNDILLLHGRNSGCQCSDGGVMTIFIGTCHYILGEVGDGVHWTRREVGGV